MDYVLDHIGSYQGHKFLTDSETAHTLCIAYTTEQQNLLLQALQAGRLLSVAGLQQCIDEATSASLIARTARTDQTSRAKQTT